MSKLASRVLVAAALCAGAGLSFAQTTVLRVSAIPDEAPTELQRKFKPLGDYLKKETGLEVQFTPVTDYAAVVEGLASNKIDLAWLGGFTFVQAEDPHRRRRGADRAALPKTKKFTSKFIVPLDSPAKSLADLKGRNFAFGAPSSTSGHLMPRYFLMQSGVQPDTDFKAVAFSGAHDATVAFVASGRADAGVLNASVWDKLVEAANPERGEGARARDHPALLRLQLDRAPRPRPCADEEVDRRLPEARPGTPRDEGDHGPAARQQIHRDQGLELRRHRGRREGRRPDQMTPIASTPASRA